METPLDIDIPTSSEDKSIKIDNTVQEAPKVATEEENTVKKPASFGKLLKSVK